MSKKVRRLLLLFLAVACFMTACAVPAFANVDPTWEEAQETTQEETQDLEPEAETEPVVVEETAPETEPEQPFSTPGNGDLGDEIKSGMKDFYTIHTKNNNTFYLVVDHSGTQDNVYMLSLIDENDLAEFMTEKETEPETQPQVIIPETKPEETEAVVTPEPEETKQTANSNFVTLIILAVIGAAAGLYYFKVYKPKKNADEWESEGMETGDGLETENEDE